MSLDRDSFIEIFRVIYTLVKINFRQLKTKFWDSLDLDNTTYFLETKLSNNINSEVS